MAKIWTCFLGRKTEKTVFVLSIFLLLFGCASVTERAIDSAIDHCNAGLHLM